jgi:hypothetical protein
MNTLPWRILVGITCECELPVDPVVLGEEVEGGAQVEQEQVGHIEEAGGGQAGRVALPLLDQADS